MEYITSEGEGTHGEARDVSYRAEYRGQVGRRRGRQHGPQDYQQIMVVAPNFHITAEKAKEYGGKHFPKLSLVSIEIETDHVAL